MSAFQWNLDHSYSRLPQDLFTPCKPTPVKNPQLLIFNKSLSKSLGLPLDLAEPSKLATLLSGNHLPPEVYPLAQAYAGHQYGGFTILGDGRAILLGEQITPEGKRYDIQLKGPGKTPYSRRGDGRAAVAPMLREYLISEAMHALGIPTTRSLAVVSTGETIQREEPLPGAILTRIASSHIRVGTFEYLSWRENLPVLQEFLSYTVQRHFPHLTNSPALALDFFDAVMNYQIDLIVHWLRVGFVHGVMNTDNISICGETIDYGPCAFIDSYDPDTVFSSIDAHGRYAFKNQPLIAKWNLTRLIETLLPLIDSEQTKSIEQAKEKLASFDRRFEIQWLKMMRSKLGLLDEEAHDLALIQDFLKILHEHHLDYTNSFLKLESWIDPKNTAPCPAPFTEWIIRWKKRIHSHTPESVLHLLRKTNPQIIPRNHLVEEALQQASSHQNLDPFLKLLHVLNHPYTPSSEQIPFQSPPPPDQRIYQTFCGT